MATVTTSIGRGETHDEDVNITGVSGSGPWTVTVDANSSVNGDALHDEHGTPRKYLITAGGGTTSLTVADHEGIGSAPDFAGGSQAEVKRYYNGDTPITDWEVDLEDTDFYGTDDAVGECYNDAVFNEAVTINGGATPGLASITLTVAAGERHEGREGTGARIDRGSTSRGIKVEVSNVTISWLEITDLYSAGSANQNGIYLNYTITGQTADHLLIHDVGTNASYISSNGIYGRVNQLTHITNCIVYDIYNNTTGSAIGIYGAYSGTDVLQLWNCTVFDVTTGGTRVGISGHVGIRATNCISMDSGTDFGSGQDADGDHNLSSDDTADDNGGSNCLISKTSANQFVSTVGGSEDLHLKTGADARKSGTILTTPTNVETDIDGVDRFARLWDIGADQYMETKTSIGQGTTHNDNSITISSVVTSGHGVYVATMSGSVPATRVVGDALYDETDTTPLKFLILAISGSNITVGDTEGVGAAPDNSGSSTPTTERYYNGSAPLTGWEFDLEDVNVYDAGDNAIGECYNDDPFDESITIDGGATPGLTSITLTVADGERHNGTAGTGTRLVVSANGSKQIICFANNVVTVEWLEHDYNGKSSGSAHGSISRSDVNAIDNFFRNLIVHGKVENTVGHPVGIRPKFRTNVTNCLVYAISNSHTGTGSMYGIRANTFGVAGNLSNNTVHDIVNDNGTGECFGIEMADDADDTMQNNIVTDTAGTTSGTVQDYEVASPSNATVDHNLASDTSASGTGSLDSKTSANQFVNTASGYEDLHLKTGADAIDAGTDLVATPTGVNFDIDNLDRDDEGDIWDIGAHQFMSGLQLIGGSIPFPNGMRSDAHTPGLDWSSTFTRMNLAGEGVGIGFKAPKSGEIDAIGVIIAYLGGGVHTAVLDFRLETLNDDGIPSGDLKDTNSNKVVTVSSLGWNLQTLTETATVSKGDWLFAGVKFVSGTYPDAAISYAEDLRTEFSSPFHLANTGGTWWRTDPVGTTIVAVRYSDGSYSEIYNSLPIKGLAETSVNTGTNPDELGIKFKLKGKVRATGFWLLAELDFAATVKLYDDSDTLLETVTTNPNYRDNTWQVTHCEYFDTTQVLRADTWYRLTVQSTTTSSIVLLSMEVDDVAMWGQVSGGQNIVQTHREDAGSWVDTPTKRITMGVMIDQLAVGPSGGDDDGGGGGGGTGKIAGRGGGLAG